MHPMSGAGGGGGDHGRGQLYGDHQPDDVGGLFFQSSACGTGSVDGGLTPSYSSITDYMRGFLEPARQLDGQTGEAANRGSATAAVTPPNSSTSSEARRGMRGRPALVEERDEEGEFDEAGSADHQGCSSSGTKKKKKEKEKKARGSRVAFATKSEVDHLDDGYRWRKYGQKAVKNSSFPRSYYRCTAARCGVKKQVERSQHDPSTVVTTYEGHHAHPSPAAHRGMAAGANGLYSLATLQQQRHGFSPSSPDHLLLAAARAMAPATDATASPAALLPRQAEHQLGEYYGLELHDPLGHR